MWPCLYYKTYTDEELYFQYLTKRPLNVIDFTPIYNLCPTHNTLVLRLVDGERQFEEMRWQLVPNFRAGVHNKVVDDQRKGRDCVREPFVWRFGRAPTLHRAIERILRMEDRWSTKASNAIMSLAGIWETWRSGTPHERRSFCILTTSPKRFMRAIHDRMPVILDSSALADWLDPEIHEQKALKEILQPCPNEWLAAVEVSNLVNSARNDGPELLQPAAPDHADNLPQRSLFAD